MLLNDLSTELSKFNSITLLPCRPYFIRPYWPDDELFLICVSMHSWCHEKNLCSSFFHLWSLFFREKRDLSKRQFQSYILTETERKENFVKRGLKRVLQLFSIFVLSEALYFSMDKGLHCCQISVLVSFVIDLMMMMTGRPSLIRHSHTYWAALFRTAVANNNNNTKLSLLIVGKTSFIIA